MQKEFRTAIFWGYATFGALGAGYATHELVEEKLVEPRLEILQNQEDQITICRDQLIEQGVEPGVVAELPNDCKPLTEDWADTRYSVSGTTSIAGYLVPSVEVINGEIDTIHDDKERAENATIPLALGACTLTLFMAYGVKRSIDD